MSDCTELEVFFRTTNKKPLQELEGIFYKQWDAVKISQINRGEWFDVHIYELSLMESLGILKAVQEHCHRNNRQITLVVKYGVVYDFKGVKLRRYV